MQGWREKNDIANRAEPDEQNSGTGGKVGEEGSRRHNF
jgi:hypothetical protein